MTPSALCFSRARATLNLSLASANKHFMVGQRVIFYITVEPLDKKKLEKNLDRILKPGWTQGGRRAVRIIPIAEESLWLGPDGARMKELEEHIATHIQDEVDFLFSITSSQIFQAHFGLEALGTSVAQLHGWWYFRRPQELPYEHRPQSAACIPPGQGDFYYDGALVGGTPLEMLRLIQAYLSGMKHDLQLGLSSTYESHLNKYFFLHKPTKLLSPEYNWNEALRPPPQVRIVRLAHRVQDR